MNQYDIVPSSAMRERRRRLWKKYFWRRIAILSVGAVLLGGLILTAVLLLTPDKSPEPPVTMEPPAVEEAPPLIEEPIDLYPKADAATVELGSEVDAQYAVLVDLTDNRIVAQKRADTRAYPASITKMMTLLVAVENTEDFSETFEMTFDIVNDTYLQGASRAGFVTGEQVTVTDLLYGCILPSGADATIGLAEHICGSEAAFVALMNDRAAQMGLKNTHFENTSGLHGEQHYSSPLDMAVILTQAMKDDTCRQVLSAVKYTTARTPQNPDGLELYSTLFSRMYGNEPEGATVTAGKTGFTDQAMHTMASYAVGDDGHEYVFVTMYGSTRWKATYDCIDTFTRFCGGTRSTD